MGGTDGPVAIRFVLSDQYTSMTREERQRLLHEGTSTTTTLSAYVEIVFDSECCLQVGASELMTQIRTAASQHPSQNFTFAALSV